MKSMFADTKDRISKLILIRKFTDVSVGKVFQSAILYTLPQTCIHKDFISLDSDLFKCENCDSAITSNQIIFLLPIRIPKRRVN